MTRKKYSKKLGTCLSCGSYEKSYAGYCQKCYTYFHTKGFKEFPSKYGKVCKVEDVNSKQYGMIICHICGKAFTKLQSHIYYVHNLSKPEYCKQFGLDNKALLTESTYNKKMSDLAYKYNMDEQVKKVGEKTRFKKGHNQNYERSYMTMQRLKNYGKEMGYKNLKYCKEEDK